VRPLSAEEMRPALVSALGIPDVQMEIVEVSAQPVPPGQLEFARDGLNRPRNGDPAAAVLWRGRLVYDGQHSLGVWAKVRLAVPGEVVVATEEIPAGSVIRTQQLRTVTLAQFPSLGAGPRTPFTVEQLSGKVARRKIAVGDSILAAAVQDPRDVTRGDTVRVLVVDGAATITLEGIAESSGNTGQTIVVHNPSTGKKFRALIESRKQVVIRPAAGESL
jgi:flagella basal body P-ring formation protein FlgA